MSSPLVDSELVEEFETAGLYDPRATNAEDRLGLLKILLESGIRTDEMVAANAEGMLPFMLAPHLIRPGNEHLSLAEVAGRVGIDVDEARNLWRTVGLPDVAPEERVLTERTVEALQLFVLAQQIYGAEIVHQIARTIGASLARIAEALPAAFAARFAEMNESREARIAEVDAELAGTMPMLINAIDVLLRYHLQGSIRRWVLSSGGVLSATQARGIGFCDLVGFTGISQKLSTDELARRMDRFETDACGVVRSAGGQVVKLIGDEIMFTAPDANALCEVGIALIARFTDHSSLPPLRGGVAFGDVLAQEGDYFGPTVNLASRLARVAEPGTLLAPKTLETLLASSPLLGTRDYPAQQLKGFADPVEIIEVKRADAM